MTHLIDKDAVVAEIEKYIANYKAIMNKLDISRHDYLEFNLKFEF